MSYYQETPLRCYKKVARFCGLCAGLAYWTETPTWITRLLVLLLILCFFPAGLLIYWLVAWLVPDGALPPDYYDRCE